MTLAISGCNYQVLIGSLTLATRLYGCSLQFRPAYSAHLLTGAEAKRSVQICERSFAPTILVLIIFLDRRYILEGTAVQISPWVIHRCPRYFYPDPDKFWPDRWISGDPSIILDKSAFIPFSTGPANCPGRPLAIIELRYVTCLLVRTFDMSFDPDYDAAQWEESLEDRFVMLKGELPVTLAFREVGKKSD